ncbi:uncharacterized protein G2W53_035562 [Senna tora]|uniref:Uncharacterized protein n=1 Tax=Senna tora TaxID=362788 RepID=A0A834W9E8_9FABA|nr:uncharacterized protein G2W53_035562 [Senna tora]
MWWYCCYGFSDVVTADARFRSIMVLDMMRGIVKLALIGILFGLLWRTFKLLCVGSSCCFLTVCQNAGLYWSAIAQKLEPDLHDIVEYFQMM